jgi:hypothetical protein
VTLLHTETIDSIALPVRDGESSLKRGSAAPAKPYPIMLWHQKPSARHENFTRSD